MLSERRSDANPCTNFTGLSLLRPLYCFTIDPLSYLSLDSSVAAGEGGGGGREGLVGVVGPAPFIVLQLKGLFQTGSVDQRKECLYCNWVMGSAAEKNGQPARNAAWLSGLARAPQTDQSSLRHWCHGKYGKRGGGRGEAQILEMSKNFGALMTSQNSSSY